MASILDYPDAQRILSRHGRKRLQLGSKAASGLRDETTSGSQSDTDGDIQLKVTEPDSDREVFFNSCRDTKVSEPTARCSIPPDGQEKSTSPRLMNMYVGSPIQSTTSLFPPSGLKLSASQRSIRQYGSNVIGPESSLKSINSRSKVNNDNRYSSDDGKTEKCRRFLKPRKTNMRRSNSDMQRRPKRPSVMKNSVRSVYSDGENKCRISESSIGHSTTFCRNYSFQFSTLINRHFEQNRSSCCHSKDTFLDSMKELYIDTMQSIRKNKVWKLCCKTKIFFNPLSASATLI